MRINLITKEEFDVLMEIYDQCPDLSLQNKGYEGIDKTKLSGNSLSKIQEINKILKKSIFGFERFQNFRVNMKTQKLEIRFQYNYNYAGGIPFTGVGYILVEELLNGFQELQK